MGKLLIIAACATLAAVSAVAAPVAGVAVSTTSAMPRGIVRTDGHGAVAVSVAGAARCGSLGSDEARLALAHSNAVRAAAGLSGLKLDTKLQRAAELQACDMASRGVMDHRGTRSAGPGMRVKQLGYRPRVTAENIAAGAASIFDLNGTLREWESSGKHRANTVIPQLKHMGIGRALSPDGRVAYWSVVYSAPK